MVKNLPAMQEIWVQSLSREDPLKNKMATHQITALGSLSLLTTLQFWASSQALSPSSSFWSQQNPPSTLYHHPQLSSIPLYYICGQFSAKSPIFSNFLNVSFLFPQCFSTSRILNSLTRCIHSLSLDHLVPFYNPSHPTSSNSSSMFSPPCFLPSKTWPSVNLPLTSLSPYPSSWLNMAWQKHTHWSHFKFMMAAALPHPWSICPPPI